MSVRLSSGSIPSSLQRNVLAGHLFWRHAGTLSTSPQAAASKPPQLHVVM